MFEMVSGQRMMTSYFRVGGLALEPPLGFFDRVRDFAGYFPDKVDEYENLLTGKSDLGNADQGRGADDGGRCDRAGRDRADAARKWRGYRSAAGYAVFELREFSI